ncbi:MAG: DUF4115 domain-containing protein [Colwellia sp.]|nr:DUF4115 domain-containing protein [Colwellia sp.]
MNKDVSAVQNSKQVDELCEDMIVVGPGQMLSEARKNLSLSIEDIAEKLNFKKCIVADIEQDIFDEKLPATYNRGYLRSYARLVNIDTNEVLSAYDMLGIAEVQRSEMQSFSNLTEKQAEHSRIMWISYFIAAVLFGLMVLWWLQTPEPIKLDEVTQKAEQISTTPEQPAVELTEQNNQQEEQVQQLTDADQAITSSDVLPQAQPVEAEKLVTTSSIENNLADQIENLAPASAQDNLEKASNVSTAVFTFSGDCWVNIYDATGERIAWGVKKMGYVMTVSGKPPLEVTLGKPELAAIVFNGQPVDMSPFNVGNIAKFTLPLNL